VQELNVDESRINILLVEDNLSYSKLVEKMLAESGSEACILQCVGTISKGLEALEYRDFDLVLLDLKLPDSEGLDTFNFLHDYSPDTPVIVLTAMSDERIALEAVKSGAQDYLIKDEVDGRQITRSIRYAVTRQREMNQIKQIDYALCREKERLSVTLDSIGDGVITTDTDGTIDTLNKVAELLTGWSQEDASGKNIDEVFLLVDEESGESKENPAIRAINANNTVGLHKGTVLVTKGREELRYVSASSSPIRDKSGIIIGVVLVFRDITQRKKMEEELLKAQKLESIGVLAGGIAHDFNNLLTAIMGNISLSRVSDFKDNNARKRLLEAESACEKARDLANQLLTFSKGGVPDSREPSSLEKVIRDTTNFTMSGSDLEFKFIVDRDIWPVEIDQGQMSQVISNLLINASQAMTNDGKITIKLENTQACKEKGVPLNGDKYVKTTVEDEGIGIPKEYLSRIFDPYFTTKQSGSGLGLATSYSIIKNHGGYIAVDSELHMGTKFYIYIPANGKLNDSILRKENGIVWGSGRVLVMDDKHEVLEAAGEMLSHIGYEVDYAKDGSEVLKKYKSARKSGKPFDSVIMDLTIPGGMGGEETLRKLRVIDPDVKAIVSSGYSSDPIMARYKKYGFKAVLPKPYEVKKLSSVLNDVLLDNS
jgi:PAS domain S-box-containing protein